MKRLGKGAAPVVLSLTIPCCGSAVDAQVDIEVRPWPLAARAAVSVTFDDAYNSHVRRAMPLLESHGYRGTFYLIVHKLLRRGSFQYIRPSASLSRWQAGASRGHELASHTLSHARLDTMDLHRMRDELITSKRMLDSLFEGESIVSLAYPFSRTNGAVAEAAGLIYESARGGEPEDRSDLHNDPASLDFMSLKGFFPCGTIDEWHDVVARAIDGRGWLIESLHPIGEPGFCSVGTEEFTEHLDYLSRRGSELWVAPVRDVVRRIRLWRALEVETTRVSEEAYELRIAEPQDYEFDWHVELYLDRPRLWKVVDESGQILSGTVAGEALVFAWPQERAREVLFLSRKETTFTSRYGWGRLKRAVGEQEAP